MPFHIVRNDITKMSCDAIVNAANSSLLGGGGVDGAIHRAAGPLLLEECRRLNGCRTGDAKLTNAYELPCRYVIHTVGPVWNGGKSGEEQALISCYERSLALAYENKCESVAFPLISAGAYGYPREQALKIAQSTITHFLESHDMTVYLVVFDKKSFQMSGSLAERVREYIDQHYVDERERMFSRRREEDYYLRMETPRPRVDRSDAAGFSKACASPKSVSDALKNLDESFTEMLLRKIDERGMKDSDCYKRANIDRKLFSKIRNDKFYKPSKPTVIAFAIALELSLAETKELLLRAGYALSPSSYFDVIIEYFIENGNYDIFEINETLFSYDQVCLGG